MQPVTPKLKEFIAFVAKLQGDEKSESQLFLDHLFRAFGHAGVIEIGGQLEYRVRLFPENKEPQFKNDLVAVTRKAAQKVADVFNALIKPDRKGKVPRERAQRFILQCVVALFAEDIELIGGERVPQRYQFLNPKSHVPKPE